MWDGLGPDKMRDNKVLEKETYTYVAVKKETDELRYQAHFRKNVITYWYK